jgi:adenylate kinase family enzyme
MNHSNSSLKPFPYRRIGVIGTTGSGKSTLARELGKRLNIPIIELDSLHWEPGWREAPRDLTRQRMQILVRQEAFVVDGNYGFLRDIIWPRLQAVFWLDYPLPIILWQLLHRTVRRSVSQELLWGTNVERLWPQFFSKDSLFLWALNTYKKHKKVYEGLLSSTEYKHIKTFHLNNPNSTKEWLRNLNIR